MPRCPCPFRHFPLFDSRGEHDQDLPLLLVMDRGEVFKGHDVFYGSIPGPTNVVHPELSQGH